MSVHVVVTGNGSWDREGGWESTSAWDRWCREWFPTGRISRRYSERMEPPRRENRGSQIEHTDVGGKELGISKRKIKAKVKTRSAMAWSLNESTWKSNISDVEKTVSIRGF